MSNDESLSLEKLRINERLKELEISTQDLKISNARIISHLESERGTYKRYTDTFALTVERMNKMLEKHEEIFHGNGKVGILTRIDRVEQIESQRSWHIRAIWTALISVIMKAFYSMITK